MKKSYRLENLCCATCADKMESALGKIDGVNGAKVSFVTAKLTLELADDVDDAHLKDILKRSEKEVRKIDSRCRITAS